jgi:hypothetical protein
MTPLLDENRFSPSMKRTEELVLGTSRQVGFLLAVVVIASSTFVQAQAGSLDTIVRLARGVMQSPAQSLHRAVQIALEVHKNVARPEFTAQFLTGRYPSKSCLCNLMGCDINFI